MPFNHPAFIKDIHEYMQQRRYHDALLHCERALRHNQDEQIIVQYIHLLLGQQYYDKAHEKLLELACSPYQSLDVYHLYEDYYVSTGQESELIALRDGLENRENRKLANHQIRQSFTYKNEDRLMIQFAEELRYWSLRTKERSSALKKSHNMLRHGLIQECSDTLQTLINSDPDSTLSKYLAAEMMLLQGNLNKAEKGFSDVLISYPNPAVIFDRLGDISYRQERYKDAILNYQRSLNHDCGSEQTWIELIECFGKLGQTDLVHKYIHRLKVSGKMNPDSLAAFERAMDAETTCPGVTRVYGLVVSEGGGNLLPIDIALTEELSCLITGNISMAMYDSVQVAFRCVKTMLGGSDNASKGLHVNIPRSVCYKDGPSAGLAFAMGMLSVFHDFKIPSRVAFTGEIDLAGHVYPVGGIYNKILAAWYSNTTQIWLPSENYRDAASIPSGITGMMSLKYVTSIQEVVEGMCLLLR